MALADILKDSNGRIVSLVVPASDYLRVRPALAKSILELGKPAGYISVNRSCANAERELAENGIPPGSFAFIDATDAQHAPEEGRHAAVCLGMVPPSDLTSLSIRVGQLVEEKAVHALLIDTASALLLYNQRETVLRFLRDLAERLRTHALTTVFLVVAEDVDAGIHSQLLQLSDAVHDVNADTL